MKLLPEHGSCFVCGAENPKGMGTRWHVREDGSVIGEVTLTVEQQGPPGHAHGGASTAPWASVTAPVACFRRRASGE